MRLRLHLVIPSIPESFLSLAKHGIGRLGRAVSLELVCLAVTIVYETRDSNQNLDSVRWVAVRCWCCFRIVTIEQGRRRESPGLPGESAPLACTVDR
jgi:hypothetical protein